MAPECLVGATPSTIRSEIYALGVTFFELLTGELPDPGHRLRGLTDDTIEAPDPRSLRPELPADLAAIVTRAMATQLSRRFPEVGAMMTAIAAVLGRVGVRRAPLAQRQGLAPVIPLHPVPHVELASENTVLRADTAPSPLQPQGSIQAHPPRSSPPRSRPPRSRPPPPSATPTSRSRRSPQHCTSAGQDPAEDSSWPPSWCCSPPRVPSRSRFDLHRRPTSR